MKKLPVVYTDDLIPQHQHISAEKASLLVKEMQAVFPRAFDLQHFAILSDVDLSAAHNFKFIEDLKMGRTENGMHNKDPQVFNHAVKSCSAFYGACEMALDQGTAMAPVHGFHHAGYDFAGGFCTLNGLMVAAVNLLEQGYIERALIIDLDGHHGNGTEDIIQHLSLENRFIHWGTMMGMTNRNQIFDKLERRLGPVLTEANIDLIIYQAGADIHIDDPLGAGKLTTEEMIRRDYLIFKTAQELKVPLVWNLAGGYNDMEKVLQLHMNTVFEWVKAYAPEHRPTLRIPRALRHGTGSEAQQ